MQESLWRIPDDLSPKQLTETANTLADIDTGHMTSQLSDSYNQSPDYDHMTSDADANQSHARVNGHNLLFDSDQSSDQSSDEFEFDRDDAMSRKDALKLLAKTRKPEVSDSEATPKRPRLALQSEFLEWEDDVDPPHHAESGGTSGGTSSKMSFQRRGRRRQQLESSDEEEEEDSVTAHSKDDDLGMSRSVCAEEESTDEEQLVICHSDTELD